MVLHRLDPLSDQAGVALLPIAYLVWGRRTNTWSTWGSFQGACTMGCCHWSQCATAAYSEQRAQGGKTSLPLTFPTLHPSGQHTSLSPPACAPNCPGHSVSFLHLCSPFSLPTVYPIINVQATQALLYLPLP